MGDNKEKLRKELMSYGKEEIVSAILDQFGYEHIASNCLRRLHEKKSESLLEAEKKAMDIAESAFSAYCEWIDRMGKKYGSEGGKIDLNEFSDADLKQTVRVCDELTKAQKERDEAIRRVERFYAI